MIAFWYYVHKHAKYVYKKENPTLTPYSKKQQYR